MKRFFVIAGVIVAILLVFLGLTTIKMQGSKGQGLLRKLRRGKGDREEIKMKLNLVRGDIIPMMIQAFEDDSADVEFRADILDLMFKNYRRSSDDRLLPVLKSALKSPDASIRVMAVDGFKVYGASEQINLIDCIDDPNEQIRRKVLTLLAARPPFHYESRQDFHKKIPEEKQDEIVKNCVVKMKTEQSPDMRFLASAIVGRKISVLCDKARQTISTGEFEKGEKLLAEALELDPENHKARIRLVRHFFAMDMKDKALEYAEKYGAVVHAPLLSKAPTIDGDPTDEVWQEAFRYVDKPFYHVTSAWAPKKVEGKSAFYISHHDGVVYVAVLGYEDDLRKLIVKHKTRDKPIFQDDCAELFFDPDNDGTGQYQFVINAIGALFDQQAFNLSKNYTCKYAAKIFHDRGYWACEFAVAAKDLDNSEITSESIWGFDVMRTRIGAAAEMCAFWPTFGASYNAHLFPILLFDGLEKPVTAPANE